MKKEIKIYIDSIDNKMIQGWFINSPAPENNKILLFLDGQYKSITQANLERQDVADAHGQLHSGFCFDIKRFPLFQHIELRSDRKDVLLNVKVKPGKSSRNKKQPLELTSPYSQERHKQLEQIKIDLSKQINGDNWYDAEPTGCWGGPDLESTLKIPALAVGTYQLLLDIASDFCGLAEMKIVFNDNPVKISNAEAHSPVILQAEVQVEKQYPFWQLNFIYPKTSPPEGESGADQRRLGIFLRSVTLTKITP